MPNERPSRGERIACWIGNAVAIAYMLWLGGLLWLANPHLAEMYDTLAAELPRTTLFVVQNGGWLYPVLFGGLCVVVVAKEFVFRDKRLSVVVAFVITIAAQFAAHGFFILYYLPMFNLMGQLSGK